MKNIPIGEVLKEYGYINEEQLQIALAKQKEDRSKRLGEWLIDLGFISEEHMLQALSDKLSLLVVDLTALRFDLESTKKIPKTLALKYNLIAINEEEGQLSIATSDPLNFYGIEDVRLVTGKNIKVNIALKNDILRAIDYYYQEINTQNIAKEVNVTTTPIVETISLFDANHDDTPVVKLLNSLLSRGFNNNASDIHIEPFEEKVSVRMRIDGMIVNYLELGKNIQDSLTVRIKILSNLDIAEKRLPQDGHFVGVIEGQEMNVRISIIPTIYGEKIVLRFLNTNTPITHASSFGMTKENYQKMQSIMLMPHGIVYVTGPTGSGKTTTLYMVLEELAKRQVNISTIEDPVERHVEKVNQVQVNTVSGLTFDVGLRSLMRQDPDIIMVGETRDSETAAISVRAAITGHLVVSTLHTNDAISAVVRLQDMGVESYLIANSLVGVVAQRLMRQICPHCKEEVEASLSDKIAIGQEIKHVYRGKGCPHCNGTGYKGRIAIHEIVVIDATVRKMIANNKDIDDILEYVKQEQQFETLQDAAIKLVREGVTSIEELNKITCYID